MYIGVFMSFKHIRSIGEVCKSAKSEIVIASKSTDAAASKKDVQLANLKVLHLAEIMMDYIQETDRNGGGYANQRGG